MRLDRLGREIKVGSYVAYTTATTGIQFDKVKKLTPQQCRLHAGSCVYSSHLLVITPEAPNYTHRVADIEQAIHDRAIFMEDY